MFPYKCDVYNMCSCACSRTKRRVSSHILTYEDTSMCNFKHMTPHLSNNFLQVHSKQPATSQLYNLQTLLTMQLFTYKDVSVANCHIGGRVTTCHKISYVLSQAPCLHANVSLRDVFMCVFVY